MDLCVVTATTNLARALPCIESWKTREQGLGLVIVFNGADQLPHPVEQLEALVDTPRKLSLCRADRYLGSVPAFNMGVQDAFYGPDDIAIIACFHDDLEIHDPTWAQTVRTHFRRHPACGLAGFGGAIGLGDADLYLKPYEPVQLARQGFRSNLTDAEAHGIRSRLTERVACLDGFSQIGRKRFFEGWRREGMTAEHSARQVQAAQPWQVLEDLGMYHHFYDGALGCLAKRYGWETWYLPVPCTHHGGRTAVGDRGYQDWALTQIPEGDRGFWLQSHQHGYDEFKDVLPLRV